MKLTQSIYFLLTLFTTIHALAIPEAFSSVYSDSTPSLFKRKGGGGGRGGGFSSGGRSSGSSSSGSRLTSSNVNRGGLTSSGSGPAPRSYRGGNYYAGGASVPFRAGSKHRGVSPAFIPAAGLAFFPGIWLYGAYAYHYPGYYYYHNRTSGQNESKPMNCYCGRFSECACEGNNETDYVTSVANNKSISRVANVDGKSTLVVNGTLPNGTTAASAAPSFRQGFAEMSGWWVVVVGVVYTIWFI